MSAPSPLRRGASRTAASAGVWAIIAALAIPSAYAAFLIGAAALRIALDAETATAGGAIIALAALFGLVIALRRLLLRQLGD